MEDNVRLVSASVSDRGLSDKRPENEDSFLELEEYGIFAVADGVGGAQAGDVASQMAVEILGEAFINRKNGSDAEETMRLAIDRANSAIHQMSQDLPQLSTMATTVVALHVHDNVATIGHVGDSRLYRFQPGKDIKLETNDHSVVAEEVRAGRMTPEQAQNHPSRNVISRALGAEATVDIDLKTIMFEPDTTFLLCSDGVTRHMDDWELESVLASGAEPADVCKKIKEICYDRGAEDNLTAVLVKVPKSEAMPVEAPAIKAEDAPEEVTVATARSPFDEPAQPISLPSIPDAEPEPVQAPEDVIETPPQTVEELSPTTTAPVAVSERRERVVPAAIPTYHEEPASGVLGRVVSALLWLIVGGLIGAVGVYYWQQQIPPQRVEVPVLTEKSANVPLTAFEESRREVDKNPEKFIAANAAEPQDAADYYLLGRAYLLSGKYWDAKRMFTEARNRLATADAADVKTLAAEISMALAIINNGPAQLAFEKDMAAGSAGQATDANQNMNSNSASSNLQSNTSNSNK